MSDFGASAVVTDQAARAASVRWLPGVRLTPAVDRLAAGMGYGEAERARVGRLTRDLAADDVVFRRGAGVIPDESGMPSGFFGWDRSGAFERLTLPAPIGVRR